MVVIQVRDKAKIYVNQPQRDFYIQSIIHCKKGKEIPLNAMEGLGGRGGTAPTHSRPRYKMGVSGQRHAPAALLPPGKGPPVPIVQEAGWAP
jgi:hypothetical protein